MPDKEGINRIVFYLTAQAFDTEAEYPKANNTFEYSRAPDGFLYLLHSVHITAGDEQSDKGIFEMSDGHYYTGWNIYPGVENRETIARFKMSNYDTDRLIPLNMWECKEFTLAIRSLDVAQQAKACVIVWYYLKKASRAELLEYALKHPITEDTFKRVMGGYSTVDAEEL
jgi:hypothetical protein